MLLSDGGQYGGVLCSQYNAHGALAEDDFIHTKSTDLSDKSFQLSLSDSISKNTLRYCEHKIKCLGV